MLYAPPPTLHDARTISKIAVAETADLLDADRTTVSRACPKFKHGRQCVANLHGAPSGVAKWRVYVRKNRNGDYLVSARPTR